jgi:hypothetical protein
MMTNIHQGFNMSVSSVIIFSGSGTLHNTSVHTTWSNHHGLISFCCCAHAKVSCKRVMFFPPWIQTQSAIGIRVLD